MLTMESLLAAQRWVSATGAGRHTFGSSAFDGLRVFEVVSMTIGPFEDWSRVRSPSRARRRRRKRHRQNIRLYYRPDPNLVQGPDGTLYGHPETVAQLRAKVRSTSQPDGEGEWPSGQKPTEPNPLTKGADRG